MLEEARESLRAGNKKMDSHLIEANLINGKTIPPLETNEMHAPEHSQEVGNQATADAEPQKPYKLKLGIHSNSFSVK